jgi:hypothetical protein
MQALVELGASLTLVAINRAYGNWQFFGRYRDTLLQKAVELIQLFPPGAVDSSVSWDRASLQGDMSVVYLSFGFRLVSEKPMPRWRNEWPPIG